MKLAKFTMSAALLLLAASAHAQMSRPGLWESTSTMSMQGMPQITPEQRAKMEAMGMKIPGAGTPVRIKMCITQEQIDKTGGTAPQRDASCHVVNIKKSLGGMTADIVCSGPNVTGNGTIVGTTIDADHVTSKVKFKGTDKNGRPMEWASEGSAAFLGSDCGDIKPGGIQME